MLPQNLCEVYHLSSRLSWNGLEPVETRHSGMNKSQIEIRPHVSQEMTVIDAQGLEINREALRRDVTVDEAAQVDGMKVTVLEGAETGHQAASIQARIAAIAIVAATQRAVAQAGDQGVDVETKHAELMSQQVETYLV